MTQLVRTRALIVPARPKIEVNRRRFTRGALAVLAGTVAARAVITPKAVLAARDTWTSVRDFYVAANGSESNNGFTPSTPTRQIQPIIDYIANESDPAGYGARVHVGDGTYRAVMTREYIFSHSDPYGWTPMGRVEIIGNEANPNQCVISGTGAYTSGWTPAAIRAQHGNSMYYFSGFKLQSQTSYGFYGGCKTELGKIEWSVCASGHIWCNNLWLYISGAQRIESDAPHHVGADFLSTVFYKPPTVVALGQRYFPNGFVRTTNGALLESHSVAFSGQFFGLRYWASSRSIVNVYGHGKDYFPGSREGVVDTGAYYSCVSGC